MTRYIYPIFTFLGLFIVGEVLLLNFKYLNKEKEISTINTVSFSITQNIQQQITMGIFSTKMLETVLKVENFDIKTFNRWGKELLTLSPSVKAVQLAPKGILKYTYPYEEHKKIIGHDLLKDKDRRKGALEALRKKDIIFVGPLKLKQNNKLAIIARKPVFKDDKFWGFAIALIYIDDIISKSFKGLESNGFTYKLFTSNIDFPELNIIAKSKKEPSNANHIYPINVPNGTWYLEINYEKAAFMESIFLHILIFFGSLFLAYLVYVFESKTHRQANELRELNESLEKVANTDILTDVPNRRNALAFMEKELALSKRYDREFSLCYIDLDNFKKLNDIYGHDIGDLALIHFSKLFSKNLRESDFFARWGGEEFFLILPMTDIKGAKVISESLRELLSKTPLLTADLKIDMTASIGISSIQNKNESIDDIINRADKALYQAKLEGRNKTVIG